MPHDVTTPSAGTRRCDGTNNNANPRPGPTAMGALDDGAREGGFTWDGTYWTEFDDIFITRIANNAQTSTQFWGILLNGQFTNASGCQQQVYPGNEVLYAFDAFNKTHTLKLIGPTSTRVSQPTKYRVTDAQTGAPIASASVNDSTTDANGEASLTFSAIGVVNIKADQADSVRSNVVVTTITP